MLGNQGQAVSKMQKQREVDVATLDKKFQDNLKYAVNSSILTASGCCKSKRKINKRE